MPKIYDNALHMMEVQGGSFVKSLANCYYAADPTNKAILRAAFAEYFANYQARFDALPVEQKWPRFAETSCSQCGKDLGPGDSGVSHCHQHGG